MLYLFLNPSAFVLRGIMKKIVMLLILAAAGVYFLLVAKPSLYYSQSLEYKNFTLRFRGAAPERVDVALDNALAKITASEFFTPDTKFDIYLPGGRSEFLVFTAFQSGAYSRINPFTGAVFIAAADFKSDQARTAPGAPATRVLGLEIAGAAGREMMRRKVKPLTYISMGEWKLRGYAEKLSGGNGIFKPADLCTGGAKDPDFVDYKYGLAVEFAMKEDGLSFPELMDKEYKYEGLEERMKKITCGG